MIEPIGNNIETNLILEQAKKVEDAKFLKIQELQFERTNLLEDTQRRLDEIKAELKALGYKIPRKKKSEEISLDTAAVSE